MALTRLAGDQSWRRSRDGAVVLAGSPLRAFRLSPAGAAVADAIERGDDLPPGHEPLTERLLESGAAHPITGPPARFGPSDVTVVVPALSPAAGDIDHIVATVGDVATVVVVDDASPGALRAPDAATLLRLSHNRGPAGARAAGLAECRTPLVAFLDSDARPAHGWLAPLLAHFDDPRVGLVAARVVSDPAAPGAVAAYETARSPLDMGREPARVRAGSRVSYVPTTAVVCRVSALGDIGGFDEQLRFGEDVDLVWRLDAAGWRVRYEPASVVHHRPRPTIAALVRQRFHYGASSGPLASRHPGRVAPVRLGAWSAAVWATASISVPAGLAAALATAPRSTRRVAFLPAAARLGLAFSGHRQAGMLLARTLTRAWWPIALVASLSSRRARRVVAAAVAVPIASDWLTHRPALDPARFAAIHVIDDVAFGAGVWAGSLRSRTVGALKCQIVTAGRATERGSSVQRA